MLPEQEGANREITEAQLREWEAWSTYNAIPPDGAAVQDAIRLMVAEIRRLRRIEAAALRDAQGSKSTDRE